MIILPSYIGIIISHYKDPGSLLTNQYFMESKGPRVFWAVAHLPFQTLRGFLLWFRCWSSHILFTKWRFLVVRCGWGWRATCVDGGFGMDFYQGVDPKIWGFPPKSSIFNRVFHYKPSILGYHYFWKHPSKQKFWGHFPGTRGPVFLWSCFRLVQLKQHCDGERTLIVAKGPHQSTQSTLWGKSPLAIKSP